LRLLLDTNVLLWVVAGSARIARLYGQLLDPQNEVFVSTASLWEVAIKSALGKLDVDVVLLRRTVLDSGFVELPVLGAHTEALVRLPPIHKDPFDRLLVAQAMSEPMRLLTADRVLAGYGAHVEVV
jgi:PIN domain nuclease of toxin-antitoxin system